MDKIRVGLWLGLAASIWFSYMTWVADHPPEPPPPAPATTAAGPDSSAPPTLGETSTETTSPAPGNAAAVPTQSTAAPAPTRLVRVTTDVLDVEINLDGGDLVQADLPEYPVDKKNPDVPIELLNYQPDTRWVLQTGIAAIGDSPAPNHEAAFTTSQTSYRLADGADTLSVRLDWATDGPVKASKTYTFRRGEYAVDLDIVVDNESSQDWKGAGYGEMIRVHNPVKRHYAHVETYSFTGPAYYDGSKYQDVKFEELQQAEIKKTVQGGWLASLQHHFVGALVPPAGDETKLDLRAIGKSYSLRAVGPNQDIAPGAEYSYPLKLFLGPKLQSQLREVSPKLDLTVDYGRLTFLSHPLFLLLEFVHGWVKNWGWSIIISTFLIKLAFYKLTATSGRSMAKMRKLAPRMKALQEKYKDDRQAQSQAVMELYKKEKVNPAAGCLPMLIQMPVFFAFYWVLVETAEMRQAPFMLWINDISVRDPYFVLPLLMGAAMFFQTRLNPPPPDPVQARVVQFMPIAFTAMFAIFPAGLVLYWLTNTVTSIAQQWRINQLVARES